MSDIQFLAWGFLLMGIAIVFSGGNPTVAPRDMTLIRLAAGVALIILGFLGIVRVLH